jgi:hypothetical protein
MYENFLEAADVAQEKWVIILSDLVAQGTVLLRLFYS